MELQDRNKEYLHGSRKIIPTTRLLLQTLVSKSAQGKRHMNEILRGKGRDLFILIASLTLDHLQGRRSHSKGGAEKVKKQ